MSIRYCYIDISITYSVTTVIIINQKLYPTPAPPKGWMYPFAIMGVNPILHVKPPVAGCLRYIKEAVPKKLERLSS